MSLRMFNFFRLISLFLIPLLIKITTVLLLGWPLSRPLPSLMIFLSYHPKPKSETPSPSQLHTLSCLSSFAHMRNTIVMGFPHLLHRLVGSPQEATFSFRFKWSPSSSKYSSSPWTSPESMVLASSSKTLWLWAIMWAPLHLYVLPLLHPPLHVNFLILLHIIFLMKILHAARLLLQ